MEAHRFTSLLYMIRDIIEHKHELPPMIRRQINDFRVLCDLSDNFLNNNPNFKETLTKLYTKITDFLFDNNYMESTLHGYFNSHRIEIMDLLILNSRSSFERQSSLVKENQHKTSNNLFTEHFKELITVNAHFSHIFTVKFDKQGQFLYSGSDDSVIKQWNISTMQLTRTYTKHKREIGDLDISDCGKLMVSCSLDKQVIVWDAYSGALLHTYKSHSHEITQIFFVESTYDELKEIHTKYIISISDKEIYTHVFKYKIVENQYGIIKSNSIKQLKQISAAFTAVEITDDKKYCVIAFKDHTLRIFQLKDGVLEILSTVSIKEQIDKISVHHHKEDQIVLLISDKGVVFLHSLYKLLLTDPHELHSENLTKLYLEHRPNAKKRTVQVHRVVYMGGYIFISGNMDALIGIKLGAEIRFFITLKVHKEDNIFWMSTLTSHNILVSGGADGYLVVWKLDLKSASILDPIIVFESQKYEEEDRTNEDILDIATSDDLVAIGTRFGGVAIFGFENQNINDYSRTPIEQEFLEDIRNINVPVNLFKTLVNRSGELVSFSQEEQREAGFFRFEIKEKNNTLYKVLKENLYHPELPNNNLTNHRATSAVLPDSVIQIEETSIDNQNGPTDTNSSPDTGDSPTIVVSEEEEKSEDGIEVFNSSSSESTINEDNDIETKPVMMSKTISNRNLLNTSNEDDFLENDSRSNSEEDVILNSQGEKRAKTISLVTPIDFILNQKLLRENSQLEEIYIPQMDDIIVYSPEAHLYFMYLNKGMLSEYTDPSYPFIPARHCIDGDRKCKITNLEYRFHSEGLSQGKYKFKIINLTLDVLEDQPHRFIKTKKLQRTYSSSRGIQFHLDMFLPHGDLIGNHYIVPFDIYEEQLRNKTVKYGKLRFKNEFFDENQTPIYLVHKIKDNKRTNLNLLTDTLAINLGEISGKKNCNIELQIKTSLYFNNFIFTTDVNQQNNIVSELNSLKENDFETLLDIYRRNQDQMRVLSLWDFDSEITNRNFVYRSGINEVQKSAILSTVNKMIENEDYYLYREVSSKHYQNKYFQTISNPIGLVDIKERLENDYYRSASQLLLELDIMYGNCLKCSVSYSILSRDCKKMVQEIKQKVKLAMDYIVDASINN